MKHYNTHRYNEHATKENVVKACATAGQTEVIGHKTACNDNETEKTERVQGVYVIYGNKLVFEEINIIYSEKDFVICDTSLDGLKTGSTIKLYDEVVVQGKELYDGKAVR